MAFSSYMFNSLIQNSFTLLITSLGTCLCYSNGATLPKFPAILVFGDSIVDTGNNNYGTFFPKANHFPYGKSLTNRRPTGRWSDGKLMPDLLAEALGIKELVPPFLDPNLSINELKTGVCFASAGGGYDEGTTTLTTGLSVFKQLESFKNYMNKLKDIVEEEKGGKIVKDSLVLIVAGTNDFLFNPRRLAFSLTPFAFEDYLLKKVQHFVKELYSLGCRKFMVAGIPPLVDLNIFSTYNKKLATNLPILQNSLPDSKIVYADIAKPMLDVASNPLTYGVIDTVTPCCALGCYTIFSPVCPDPSKFFIFDGLHPTEKVYRVVAKYLVENSLRQFLISSNNTSDEA